MRRILQVCLLLASQCLPLAAQESSSKVIETKLALEASLERRMLEVLSKVIGTKDIVVMVNVELYDRPHEKTLEEQETSDDVLPGVPIKDRPDISGILDASLTMVKTIRATVIVDKRTKTEELIAIRKVVGKLLGIPLDRTDLLIVDTMDFKKGYKWTDIFKPPDLWRLAWLILALIIFPVFCLVFATPLLKVGRELVTTLKTRQPAQESAAREPRGIETKETALAPVATIHTNGSNTGDEEGKGHFWFLKESHLPVLLHIFKRLTPESLPIVIHYAPPDLASRLLASLDESTQKKVTLALSKVGEIREDILKLLENKIRSQIDRIIGGEEKLLTILEELPTEMQNSILKNLSEGNPEVAEKLQEQMISITDLAKLTSPELQLALKRIPIKTIAPILKGSETLAAAVIDKLPEEMAERFKQEVDLVRQLSKERLETEKRRVVNVLKGLVREGWIVINRNNDSTVYEEHKGTNGETL